MSSRSSTERSRRRRRLRRRPPRRAPIRPSSRRVPRSPHRYRCRRPAPDGGKNRGPCRGARAIDASAYASVTRAVRRSPTAARPRAPCTSPGDSTVDERPTRGISSPGRLWRRPPGVPAIRGRERGMGAASPSAARSMRRCVYPRRPAAVERAHHAEASAGATGRARRRRRPGSRRSRRCRHRRSRPLRARLAPGRAAGAQPAHASSRGIARLSDASSCRARMAPKLSGGSAIASRLSAAAIDAAGESRASRDVAVDERPHRAAATGVRSRPAPGDPRWRGIAWPVPDAA